MQLKLGVGDVDLGYSLAMMIRSVTHGGALARRWKVAARRILAVDPNMVARSVRLQFDGEGVRLWNGGQQWLFGAVAPVDLPLGTILTGKNRDEARGPVRIVGSRKMIQELEDRGVVCRIDLVGGAERKDAFVRFDRTFAIKPALHPGRQTLALFSVCRGYDERLGVPGLEITMTLKNVPVIRGRTIGGDFSIGGRSK